VPSPKLICALLALACGACARHASAPAAASPASATRHSDCLPDGSGYLRLRVRGAQNFDLDWHDEQLHCEGGPRPDQSGLRLSFAAVAAVGEHRPRLVLGVAAALGGGGGREVPTNVTLIMEGENQLYSTRGDDKCTIDELVQQPIAVATADSENTAGAANATAGPHAFRIAGRGFCSSPATSLDGRQDVVISRFDFAGRAVDADVADHPQ
jgi:hypothetical protein